MVETFGEEGFQPVNKEAAYGLSEKQQELTIAYSNESMPIVNQYIPGDETSFTIIAFLFRRLERISRRSFLKRSESILWIMNGIRMYSRS